MTKRTVIKDAVPWIIEIGKKNERTLTITETDESPKDLTGYSFFCEIRARGGGRLLVTVSVDETDIATGVVILEVSKEAGEAVGRIKGVYSVMMQEDADKPNTICLFRGDVTFIKLATEVSVS